MIDAILLRHELHAPDGRPLFAYRLTDTEFAQLTAMLPEAERRKHRQFDQLFCLYVAEWYRRRFTGGSFSWDAALEPLRLTTATMQRRMKWTLDGLRAWKRTVRVGADGSRMFLFSLVAEGGFPLRLLQRDDGNRFRRYFLALLEVVAGWSSVDLTFRASDPSALADLGKRPAYLLPRNLASDDLTTLCAELMTKLWLERNAAGPRPTGTDWLEHLDRKRPGWRDRLPIEVEDENAKRLLDRLLVAGEKLVAVHSTAIRWVLHGSSDGKVVGLRRSLRVPVNFLAKHVTEAIGREPSGTIRVSAVAAESGDAKCIGDFVKSRTRQPDGWEFDSLVDDGQVPASMTLDSLCLRCELPGLERLDCWDVPGANAPSTEAPWVFVRSGGDQDAPTLELVATGSCRRSESELWLAAPGGWSVDGAASLLDWHTNAAEGRSWWLVDGDVQLDSRDARWSIHAGATLGDDAEYGIAGATLPAQLGSRPVYRGLPDVRVGNPSRVVPVGQLQVKDAAAGWRPAQATDWGELHLRHVVAGETRFTVRLWVAPSDLAMRATWGNPAHPGAWRLESRELDAVDGSVAAGPPRRDGASWAASSLDTNATTLELTLMGRRGQRIRLTLPNPTTRIEVRSSIGVLARPEEILHVARLEHWRVRWQGPDKPLIHATLWKVPPLDDPAPIPDCEWTLDGPRALEPGLPCELYLSALRTQIGDWLSSADDLDAELQLRFQWLGAVQRPVRIRIRRYDWTLTPKKDEFAFKFIGDGTPIVEAKLLRRANEPAVELVADDSGVWRFPAAYVAESGTWLVTARDGNWHRSRPTAKFLQAPEGGSDQSGWSVLAKAIEARDSVRPDEILVALTALNSNLADDGWPLVEALAVMTKDLPAAAIDAVKLLRHHPQIAATVIVRLDDKAACQALHRSLAEMGVVWEALHLSHWVSALAKYHAYLGAFLPADFVEQFVAGRVQRLVELVPTAALGLGPCTTLIGMAVDSLGLDPTQLQEVRAVGNPAFAPYLQILREDGIQDLLRAKSEAQWPSAKLTDTVFAANPAASAAYEALVAPTQNNRQSWQLAVLSTPAIVASAARYGVLLDDLSLLRIRTCRSFHEPFFQSDVKCCLALLPGLTPDEVVTP